MDVLLPLLTLLVGLFAGGLAMLLWTRPHAASDPELGRALAARGEDQAVIRDGLDRLGRQLDELDRHKAAWESQLNAQVQEVRHSTDSLRRETTALSTALRRPDVRGRWGEVQLRRTVELAGMVDHCDFTEQVTTDGDDGRLRPDLVVHLAGGRSVVVDSKVPLAAHLDALSTDDPDEQRAHLERHARQVRTHVQQLAAKSYWTAQDDSPEFVVMYVALESSLAAALDVDRDLLEYAAARRVVLATPSSLIALLRTVAHGWTTEALAEQTREIAELGRLLHERLGTMGGHLDKVGRSLSGAVQAYNSAIGSLESRVLVTARTFSDLAVTDDDLEPPRQVTDAPRTLAAPELHAAVADERPELDFDGHEDDGEPPATGGLRGLA